MNRSIINRFASLPSVALLVSCLPLAAQTAVPGLMSYQAFVTDDANQPLAAAEPTNYEVIFRIYDSATGNTVIWAEKQTVSIFVGNFSVLLGNGGLVSGEPKPEDLADVFTAKERYMGITVGENAEFTPRQRIVPNAYAYRAKVAESVGGVISLDGTSTSLSGALDVDGHTNLDGFTSDGLATINSNLNVRHSINIDDMLNVDGQTNLSNFRSEGNGVIVGTLGLYGAGANLYAEGALTIDGNANLNARLDVDGNSLFKGHVDIRNNFYHGVDGAGHTHKIFGNTVGAFLNWNPHIPELQLMGSAKMYINNFLSVNGDTQLDGFRSDGNGTINGTLDVNGLLDAGPLTVQNPHTSAEVLIRATAARANAHDPVFKIEDKNANGWVKVHYGPAPTGHNPFVSQHFEVMSGYAWKPQGGDWGNPSDKRLKKNIQDLDGALDKLLKLRSVTYEHKDPKHRYYVAGKQTGFIAQEVEEVFPEWVQPLPFGPDEDEPDLKGVSVTGFPALSVQALRELRAEKDAQIETLKEANSALETRLARLEALLEKPVSGSIKESN